RTCHATSRASSASPTSPRRCPSTLSTPCTSPQPRGQAPAPCHFSPTTCGRRRRHARSVDRPRAGEPSVGYQVHPPPSCPADDRNRRAEPRDELGLAEELETGRRVEWL